MKIRVRMTVEYVGNTFEMDQEFDSKYFIDDLHDNLTALQYDITEKAEERERIKGKLRHQHNFNPIYREMMEQGLV